MFSAKFPLSSSDTIVALARLLGLSHPKPPQRAYPHSSTRQRARYARQLAAGQLSMEGV